MSKKDESCFLEAASAILNDELMLSTRAYTQHADISVYTHCVMVARYSARLSRFLHLKCSTESLIRGALLHDFFLYDWHIAKSKEIGGLHGFVHPVIAAENAKKRFTLTDREYNIIIRHMWPLTLTRIPVSKEGWVVSLVDKYCSLLETLRLSPYSDAKIQAFVAEITQ